MQLLPALRRLAHGACSARTQSPCPAPESEAGRRSSSLSAARAECAPPLTPDPQRAAMAKTAPSSAPDGPPPQTLASALELRTPQQAIRPRSWPTAPSLPRPGNAAWRRPAGGEGGLRLLALAYPQRPPRPGASPRPWPGDNAALPAQSGWEAGEHCGLSDHLTQYGGHIGCRIRKDERNQGAMLSLALAECRKLGLKKVPLTCDKENIASAKVILANGGVLRNEVSEDDRILHHAGTGKTGWRATPPACFLTFDSLHMRISSPLRRPRLLFVFASRSGALTLSISLCTLSV